MGKLATHDPMTPIIIAVKPSCVAKEAVGAGGERGCGRRGGGWDGGQAGGSALPKKSKIARVIGWPSPQLSNYETASRTLSVAIVRPCVSVAPYSNAEAMCSGLLL